MSGWTAASARDRIMLVREKPPTLGYRRLSYHRDIYPDLRAFLDAHGKPDFLVETTGEGYRYLVFYYLRNGLSFVMRTRGPETGIMECTGPFRMSPNERAILSNLRTKAATGEKPKS